MNYLPWMNYLTLGALGVYIIVVAAIVYRDDSGPQDKDGHEDNV